MESSTENSMDISLEDSIEMNKLLCHGCQKFICHDCIYDTCVNDIGSQATKETQQIKNNENILDENSYLNNIKCKCGNFSIIGRTVCIVCFNKKKYQATTTDNIQCMQKKYCY